MDCDRCGREIEGGVLAGIGARGRRNLCRTCWGVETRSSNSRLISALNEMTRDLGQDAQPEDDEARRRGAAPECRQD